jgi:hypothetical protein
MKHCCVTSLMHLLLVVVIAYSYHVLYNVPFLKLITDLVNRRVVELFSSYTRWFKYDRDKLLLFYTKLVPVIFLCKNDTVGPGNF